MLLAIDTDCTFASVTDTCIWSELTVRPIKAIKIATIKIATMPSMRENPPSFFLIGTAKRGALRLSK
jgi:hypothetical protein